MHNSDNTNNNHKLSAFQKYHISGISNRNSAKTEETKVSHYLLLHDWIIQYRTQTDMNGLSCIKHLSSYIQGGAGGLIVSSTRNGINEPNSNHG